ncbi:hypothetical protein D3C76_938140 [compost metagenome]
MVTGKPCQRDFLYLAASILDGLQLAHQWMSAINLIVSISTDHHQVLQVRACQQILQQVERRRVEPLKIIEEQSQRMFTPGENTDESAKHELKATLCLLWLKLWHRRLVTHDEFQFRDEISHEPGIGLQGLL